MKAITIRGIDESVSTKIKALAKNEGKSVNQFVLDTLKQRTGMQKNKIYSKKYSDLDHLFGTWTSSEFNRIQTAVNEQRKIDIELWG